MRTYVVGGAVRDSLLGLPVQDRDWVVVGETVETMLSQGFRPVGKDFPVFLHPDTHEEYALARTERKSGHGYTGFVCHAAPDVTLEEDLARRDLTINAIARSLDGSLIDPYGGARDIEARVFRHVGPAFAEDPVRILRLARFGARMPAFTVAPETQSLMQQMCASGELDHLVPERVWQELSRGLMEPLPSRMFMILRECGALRMILPELDRLFGVPQSPASHPEIDTGTHVMSVIDQAARQSHTVDVRWACLLHDLGKAETSADALPNHSGHEARGVPLAEQVSARLRVPASCRDLAVLFTREHGKIGHILDMDAEDVISLMERCDLARRPERFQSLLSASVCDYYGRAFDALPDWPGSVPWSLAITAFQSINSGSIARSTTESGRIPALIHAARTAAVRAALQNKTALTPTQAI